MQEVVHPRLETVKCWHVCALSVRLTTRVELLLALAYLGSFTWMCNRPGVGGQGGVHKAVQDLFPFLVKVSLTQISCEFLFLLSPCAFPP